MASSQERAMYLCNKDGVALSARYRTGVQLRLTTQFDRVRMLNSSASSSPLPSVCVVHHQFSFERLRSSCAVSVWCKRPRTP